MKSIIINKFGGSEVFEIADTSKPTIQKNQVLIKVQAVGINPIDWKQRNGNHKLVLGSSFPIILGYDVSGEVVEVGSLINRLKVGDKVMGVLDNKYGGAMAQYAKGSEDCFIKIPHNISMEEAAAYPMVSLTSLQAFRDKAKLKPGQTVLINGASGGVGHIAVQIAKLMQAHVIAVAGTHSQSFVGQFEPDEYIDYSKQDITELRNHVDIFFDVAGVYTFPQISKVLKPKGVYINSSYIDSLKKAPLNFIHQLFRKGKRAKALLMKQSYSDLECIARWISTNKLKVIIDEQFSMENIVAAHDYAQKGHSKGKNVIVIK